MTHFYSFNKVQSRNAGFSTKQCENHQYKVSFPSFLNCHFRVMFSEVLFSSLPTPPVVINTDIRSPLECEFGSVKVLPSSINPDLPSPPHPETQRDKLAVPLELVLELWYSITDPELGLLQESSTINPSTFYTGEPSRHRENLERIKQTQ